MTARISQPAQGILWMVLTGLMFVGVNILVKIMGPRLPAPEAAARREAVEEAHLQIDELIKMVGGYASPGYSTEFYHCFLGLADLSGRGQSHAGLDEENEDIRNHVIPFAQAMNLLESGEINAAPLAMMLLWLANKRDSLRR